MTLGEKVKARREQIGMTQEELARKMGYKSKSSITKIEKGERDLPQSKIKQIADCLGTSPSYLMGWQREEPHIDMDMLHKAVEMAMKAQAEQIEPDRIDVIAEKLEKLSEADLDRLEAIIDAWIGG